MQLRKESLKKSGLLDTLFQFGIGDPQWHFKQTFNIKIFLDTSKINVDLNAVLFLGQLLVVKSKTENRRTKCCNRKQ